MKKCPCDIPKKKGGVPSRDERGKYACGGPVKKLPGKKAKK